MKNMSKIALMLLVALGASTTCARKKRTMAEAGRERRAIRSQRRAGDITWKQQREQIGQINKERRQDIKESFQSLVQSDPNGSLNPLQLLVGAVELSDALVAFLEEKIPQSINNFQMLGDQLRQAYDAIEGRTPSIPKLTFERGEKMSSAQAQAWAEENGIKQDALGAVKAVNSLLSKLTSLLTTFTRSYMDVTKVAQNVSNTRNVTALKDQAASFMKNMHDDLVAIADMLDALKAVAAQASPELWARMDKGTGSSNMRNMAEFINALVRAVGPKVRQSRETINLMANIGQELIDDLAALRGVLDILVENFIKNIGATPYGTAKKLGMSNKIKQLENALNQAGQEIKQRAATLINQ